MLSAMGTIAAASIPLGVMYAVLIVIPEDAMFGAVELEFPRFVRKAV